MTLYNVRITHAAEQDLRGIFEYIAFELMAPDSAVGQLDRPEQAIESLETFPDRHALYGNRMWRSRGLRMMPVDNYCVFYIPSDDEYTVSVIRIMYSSRDIKSRLAGTMDEKSDH